MNKTLMFRPPSRSQHEMAPRGVGLPVPAVVSTTHRYLEETSDQAACIAVSIVSNNRLLCEGLGAVLGAYPDLHVEGTYSQVSFSRLHMANLPEHVVLLDATAGREATLAWIRHCKGLTPPTSVVALELANDVDAILTYLEAGADGFTLQGASVAEVVEAIDRVRQGVVQFKPEVTDQLFARLAALKAPHRQPSIPTMPLTPRELEILCYIAADYSNQEIATTLVIGLTTVKNHVHNILEKLKVRHRWDAARYAAEQGWLDVDQVEPSRSGLDRETRG